MKLIKYILFIPRNILITIALGSTIFVSTFFDDEEFIEAGLKFIKQQWSWK